jgi:hypothetical protein
VAVARQQPVVVVVVPVAVAVLVTQQAKPVVTVVRVGQVTSQVHRLFTPLVVVVVSMVTWVLFLEASLVLADPVLVVPVVVKLQTVRTETADHEPTQPLVVGVTTVYLTRVPVVVVHPTINLVVTVVPVWSSFAIPSQARQL